MTALDISHTHADGTQLAGSAKGDGVWEICQRLGWRWHRDAGIYVRGSRDRHPDKRKIAATVAALEAAGHTVTVTIDDTYRPETVVAAERGERAEDRADRLDAAAGQAAGRAEAASRARDAIGDRIPLGQPILVGHHSEGRHRRDIARLNTLDERRWHESDRAAELSRRARAAIANETAKHTGPAVLRRIETRQAERRAWVRNLDAAITDDGRAHYQAEIDHLDDQLAYDQAILAELEATGVFVQWLPAHFEKGDRARVRGAWRLVRRVNAKSLSLVDDYGYARPVPWDEIGGRRRGDLQWDTPSAEPWAVADADALYRWGTLVHCRGLLERRYDDEARQQRAWYDAAVRIVYGLPSGAPDAEVAAFDPAHGDRAWRVAHARLCLAVYDRLAAGELAADVAATTTPLQGDPSWRMPAGDPTDVRVVNLARGDIIAGMWDRGAQTSLWRGFVGPVDSVSEVERRGERGDWVTVTLTTGAAREFQTHVWMAVHVAAMSEDGAR